MRFCDQIRPVAFTGNPRTTGDYSGIWEEINYKVTPARQGYSKFNFFVDLAGDAYMDKNSIGFNFFLFKFGTISALFPQGLARIDMQVLQHTTSPGKESWAKKAELIQQMEEVLAIFWA